MGLLGFAPPQGLPSGGSGSSSGIAFQDEGSAVVTATTANFVGAGVAVTNVAGVATVTIPGGGTIDHTVVNGSTTKQKTADETVSNSATPQDDNHLQFTGLVSGQTYHLEGHIFYSTAFGTGGFRCDFDGGTATFSSVRGNNILIDIVTGSNVGFFNDISTDYTRASANNLGSISFSICLVCNGDGTLIFRWAQETATTPETLTVVGGGFMRLTRTA